VGYPTSGDPSLGIASTKGGAFWFHQIGEELRAVLVAANIIPSTANNAQVLAAIQSLITNRNISGLIRSLTPIGGALVREYADITNAATVGGIEICQVYNCAIDPATGIWAGRDVADICWIEKTSDAGGLKEFWYAPTAAAGVVPAWVKIDSLDLVNALRTINGSLVATGNVSAAAATAAGHTVNLGQFLGSLSGNGYLKIPMWNNGTVKDIFILQWGISVCGASNPTSVTFPIAFPNAVLNVLPTPLNGSPGYQSMAVLNSENLNGFTWSAFFAAGAGVVMNAATTNQVSNNWIAIGK